MKLPVIFLLLFTFLYADTSLPKVNLYLKWKHQFQFAGFYMAKEKGFYKDFGIDVNFIESTPNQDIITHVLNEKNAFGISDSMIVNDILNGKKLELLGAILQHSPTIFLSLEESLIQTPKDFKGKRFMLDSSSKESMVIDALLNKYGVKKEEVSFIETSYALEDLIQKKIDIYTGYVTNEPFVLQELGIKYNYVYPSTLGMDVYGDILFTSKKNVERNSNVVDSFFIASMKGWMYAFEHIDETIALIMNQYNTQKFTYDKYLYEAMVLKDLSEISKGNFGKIDLNRINHIFGTLFLSKKDFDSNIINNVDTLSLTNEKYLKKLDLAKNKNDLTFEEITFLKEKKEINMCVTNNFAPYFYLYKGAYKGIFVDYAKELEKSLNVKINFFVSERNDSCKALIANKKVDISPIVFSKSFTNQSLKVTNDFMDTYLVLATNVEEQFLVDIKNLENKIVGIPEGLNGVKEFFKTNYPYIILKEYGDMDAGFNDVLNKNIYGFIGYVSAVAHEIQNKYSLQLKIMYKFDDLYNIGFLMHKDANLLSLILNKAIYNMNQKRVQEIKNSWVYIKQEENINYALIYKILGVVFAVFLVILYRHYVLKKMNQELKKTIALEVDQSRQKDKVMFQQAKLASMGEMLNNIAHQWRQPLNSINSYVAVLDSLFMKKGIADQEVEKYLLEIENQTKYMSQTIDNFKNYINPLKEKEKFKISEALNDVLSIVKYNFEQLEIKIDVNVLCDYEIEGYKGEYIQTIISILNNSKEAFEHKKIKNPKIKIFVDNILIIDDNAGGIDDTIIDRVFEPYFTTKYKHQGTGTGLYMAKMIIERSMNGALSIENIKNGIRLRVKV